MEMTAVWKERKRKSPFPLFPHRLGKLANSATFPHSHSFGDDWRFPFFSNSFNFNSTKSVTYMPGTFCYRHARPHNCPESRIFGNLPLSSLRRCTFSGCYPLTRQVGGFLGR
jgi:hypothetical protein